MRTMKAMRKGEYHASCLMAFMEKRLQTGIMAQDTAGYGRRERRSTGLQREVS